MKKKYSNLLLALELDPKTDKQIIERAKQVADAFKAKLTLIHVIEHLSNYGAAYGVSAGVDVEEELRKEAIKSMKKVGTNLKIPQKRQLVLVGPAKYIILEQAKKLKADLIVVGSHGRSGVRLLLGSTSNAVLHGAKCDVLAVRIKNK